MSKYVRITQARKRKINRKRWAQEKCTTVNNKSGGPYVSDLDKWYQHLLDVRNGYAERDRQGRYIVGSGRKYKELKEMRHNEKPVVNLVTPVAQALEMAKPELKRKTRG